MSDIEEWRPVAGFPHYEVSSFGRVRSSHRDRDGNLRARNGGIVVVGLGASGYPVVRMTEDGVPARRAVHRLVAEAFLGDAGDGLEVLHLDDLTFHNRLSNLRYGTRRENHGMKRAPGVRRERCPYAHPLVEGNLMRLRYRVCRACWEAYDPTTGPRPELADEFFLQVAIRDVRAAALRH